MSSRNSNIGERKNISSAKADPSYPPHVHQALGNQLSSLLNQRTRLAVGRDVSVSGRLSFSEAVRIEGHFRGEVTSVDLIVVDSAGYVEGRISAPRLVVLGEVRGNVSGAHQVMIGPLARFSGQLEAKYLTVCEGARVEGELHVVPDAGDPRNT